MNTPQNIDEIMAKLNAKAKAEGRYLGKAFWEIPVTPGSLQEVPETAESQERIEWLKQQIAELQEQKHERQGAVSENGQDADRPTESSPVAELPAQPLPAARQV